MRAVVKFVKEFRHF